MNRLENTIFVVVMVVVLPTIVYSQGIEDALRLWQRNTPLTARAGALGYAYTGIADDAATLQVNPAGLTLIPKPEFTVGFALTTHSLRTEYYNAPTLSGSLTTPIPSQIGIIVPIRSHSGAIMLGLSYSRDNYWNENSSVSGIHPTSSIVQHWLKTQSSPDLSQNRAWRLFLADTVRGVFVSPMKGNLRQTSFVQQRGGLHAVSAGAGIELLPALSVGATLIGRWGTYRYDRLYNEFDEYNVHNALDVRNFTSIDIHNLQVQEEIQQVIGGIQMVVGMQAKFDDVMRIGISVYTPAYYTIQENNSWSGTSTFDNGDTKKYQEQSFSDLSVVTPWVFSAGISAHLNGFTVSAGIEYTDVTELEFQTISIENYNSITSLNTLNASIRQFLTNQYSWGVGAEYEVPSFPLVVRGSFSRSSSPYRLGDVESDTDIIGAGLGWYVLPNCRLDLTYRQVGLQTQTYLYPQSDAIYRESRAQRTVMLQALVRW